MLRRDRDRRVAAALGDLPSALVDQPVDERADGVGQRLLDRDGRDVARAVRLGHRQRDDRRLLRDRGAMRRERHVVGLERDRVAGHDRRERGVHARLDLRHAAEAGGQRDAASRRSADEPLADLAVDADVGAAEPVDRLLRIADDEQASGHRDDRAPVGLVGIGGGEQQQDLRLQRIGVLELVDEDVREARLEAAADGRVAADEIARLEEQIEKVERAGARLQLLVAVDRARQLLLQRAARSASASIRN